MDLLTGFSNISSQFPDVSKLFLSKVSIIRFLLILAFWLIQSKMPAHACAFTGCPCDSNPVPGVVLARIVELRDCGYVMPRLCTSVS